MKNKKLNLKIWIPVAVVALVIIISLATLVSSRTRVAFLNIESGNVEVDSGKGWTAAKDGMDLSIQDKVRTGEASSAVIVLYESIIVELDANTEVSIEQLSKDKVKLNQQSGSTWNKFAAISGIQSFEVETPTTVATVRGTEFWVDMDSVGVDEGQVDAKMKGKLLKLVAGKKGVLRDGAATEEDFTKEDVQRAILKKEVIIKHLKNLRQDEINKHKIALSILKKAKGWNDADVTRFIDKLDNGQVDEKSILEESPLPAESIDRFTKITTEIKKQNEDMRRLEVLKQEMAGGTQITPTAKEGTAKQVTVEAKPTIAKPEISPTEPKIVPGENQMPLNEPINEVQR